MPLLCNCFVLFQAQVIIYRQGGGGGGRVVGFWLCHNKSYLIPS